MHFLPQFSQQPYNSSTVSTGEEQRSAQVSQEVVHTGLRSLSESKPSVLTTPPHHHPETGAMQLSVHYTSTY